MAITMPAVDPASDILVVVGWVIALMAVIFAAQMSVRLAKWAFYAVTDFIGITEVVWSDDGPVRINRRSGDEV